MLNLIPADLGRPIGDIRPNLEPFDLEQMCRKVIDTVTATEREVKDRDGGWFSLRIRPYMTTDNRIDGVLIMFHDISALKTSVEQISAARDSVAMIADSVPTPLVVLDAEYHVTWASRSFYETFRVTREETMGRFIHELGNGQWNIPQLRKALADMIEKNIVFHEFAVDHDFARIGAKTMLLNARPFQPGASAKPLILLAIEDVTVRENTEPDPPTSE